MTYDTYKLIFICSAILCGIMFVISILVFAFLKIPKVISDLSGATARKAIKNIREHNEASGDKGYRVSAFNQARGKLTDKISQSGNVISQYHMQMAVAGTTKIKTQELTSNENPVIQIDNASVIEGNSAGETVVLADTSAFGETVVLTETSAFGETLNLNRICEDPSDNEFVIEYEITYIHTDECI